MINLFNVSFDNNIKKLILSTLESKAIAAGPFVTQLESQLTGLYPRKYALAVNDMTNGMTIVLDALGIKKNDEVIASPFSCLATTSPMALLGIQPVWADINPGSMAMEVDSVKKSITSKTKAILIYHVAGYPSDIEALKKVAKNHNLLIIEDCNSAFGSEYNQVLLGSDADATVLSFYPNRQVGSIDGGAILFKEQKHYELAKLRRRYGVDFNGFRKLNGEINEEKDVTTYGYSATMNNISAGIICEKINCYQNDMIKTEANVAILDEVVEALHEKFGSIRRIVPLRQSKINHWVYFAEVTNKANFIKAMKKKHVHVSSLHLRNDLYSCFNSGRHTLLGIDKIAEKHVAIPCGYWLNSNDMDMISEALFETISYQVS